MKVTYSNATFPEEIGCSTLGTNKFSLNLYSEVPNELHKDIFLSIYGDSFSKTVNCSWNDGNKQIDCNCPQVYERTLQLPHYFAFKLNINGQDSVSTQLATSKPFISYFKPSN